MVIRHSEPRWANLTAPSPVTTSHQHPWKRALKTGSLTFEVSRFADDVIRKIWPPAPPTYQKCFSPIRFTLVRRLFIPKFSSIPCFKQQLQGAGHIDPPVSSTSKKPSGGRVKLFCEFRKDVGKKIVDFYEKAECSWSVECLALSFFSKRYKMDFFLREIIRVVYSTFLLR